MKKRLTLILIFVCVLGLLAFGAWRKTWNFLGAAVDCVATDELLHGTDFTSNVVNLKNPSDLPNLALITIEFIPEDDTDTATLDFDFEITYVKDLVDAEWSLLRGSPDTPLIQIPQNALAVDPVTGLVRVSVPVYVPGMSHIRLYRIENTSTTHDCEDILVKISE